MPYQLTWEPRGLYRRYFSDLSFAERFESLERICADPRFDELRYVISDYLAVQGFEASDERTEELAALHIGVYKTNPRMVIIAVAQRPDILAAIEAYQRHAFTPQPYQVFATTEAARAWIDARLTG